MATSAIIALIFAILGTAASVGSGIYANTQNKKIADQNIQEARDTREDSQDFAREQQQTANQATYQMFQAMDAPEARVKQLKNAGLSVGLMYGNGAGNIGSHASATGSAPGATAGSNAPYLNPLLNLQQTPTQAIKELVEAEKAGKEGNKIEKDTEKAGYEIQEIIARTKKTEEEAKTNVVTRNFQETQNSLAQLQLKFETATFDTRIEILDEELNLTKQNVNKTRQEVKGQRIDNQYKPKLYQSTLDLNEELQQKYIAETAKAVADEALSRAEKLLTDEKTNLTIQEKNNMWLEYRKLTKIVEDYEAFGYKGAEADNWASEIVALARYIVKYFKGEKVDDESEEQKNESERRYGQGMSGHGGGTTW